MGAAAPVFTVAMGAAQYKSQGEIGKFNQRVNNRNALILENQADQLEAKADFDIAQFKKNFRKIEGQTKVALAKSGVVMDSGSAYNIMLSNAYEAKLQENLIIYNSRVAAANKREEANFARIRGTMARNESKLAQILTVAQTGSNLYSMMNKPKGTV
jgi:activator of 2-hydroxyglutaryl-CoA dehydratase